ncbi:hypothetical protein [Staphylococcus felis]|uniref:hypothetical protein n=1 Tax=Staphylococcus felis TaxID=46127 RepID=UPI002480FF9D|nr:hypothetical protein [Staphylococcus felis]
MEQVHIYNNLEESADLVNMYVAFDDIDKDGNIASIESGNIKSQRFGFTLIVKKDVVDQFEKLKITLGKSKPELFVKDNMEITQTPEHQNNQVTELNTEWN